MLRFSMIVLLVAGLAGVSFADYATKSDPAGHPATTFTIKIENISTPSTLQSSTGATAPAPNSPGLWIIHTGTGVLFTTGKPDRGMGLEAQAEDGNPAPLAGSVKGMKGVVASGAFDTPVGDEKPGPALPGKSYQFSFEAHPGDRLTLATMFGQSNDLFYAPREGGIALFQKGKPVSGDVTSQIYLWDAGTEVNQEPGFGADQAPRQSGPNTGAAEKKLVRLVSSVKDGFKYPTVAQVIRVTISSTAVTMR